MSLRDALSVLVAAAFLIPSAVAAGPQAVCEPSVWSLKNQGLQPDGSLRESEARSVRYCLLSGALEMDEFRALGPSGEVIFRGVSFTYPRDSKKEHRTLWVMVGDPGNTLIRNVIEGGKVVSAGAGVDGMGEFDEQSVTTVPARGRYRFEMSRNYRSMKRWLEPFNIIDATRSTEQPPALPGRALPRLQQRMSLLEDPPDEVLDEAFILDGHAHLSIRRGEGEARWLRYAAALDDAALLVYEWQLGSDLLRKRTLQPAP